MCFCKSCFTINCGDHYDAIKDTCVADAQINTLLHIKQREFIEIPNANFMLYLYLIFPYCCYQKVKFKVSQCEIEFSEEEVLC